MSVSKLSGVEADEADTPSRAAAPGRVETDEADAPSRAAAPGRVNAEPPSANGGTTATPRC